MTFAKYLELAFNLLPVVILIVAVMTDKAIKAKRKAYLDSEEKRLSSIIILNTSKPPADAQTAGVGLVTGSVAIANNSFINFISAWKHVFGGELKGFTRLTTDARRTALIRLLQDAENAGANAVYNLRYATSMVQGSSRKNTINGIELIAYATAVKYDKNG